MAEKKVSKKVAKKKVTKKQAAKKASTKKAATKKSATKKAAVKKQAAKKAPAKKAAAKPQATGGRVRVTLVRSLSSTPRRHRLWVRGLGLKRMNHTVEVADTPANRGMITRAAYLLRVENVA